MVMELTRYQRYYQSHKQEFREYARRWRARNPDKYKQESLRWRENLRVAVLQNYSNGAIPTCFHCGVTDIDVLCIDHIYNNGATQKKNRTGGSFYQWLRTSGYPSGYQVLCWNCNHKKELLRLRGSSQTYSKGENK